MLRPTAETLMNPGTPPPEGEGNGYPPTRERTSANAQRTETTRAPEMDKREAKRQQALNQIRVLRELIAQKGEAEIAQMEFLDQKRTQLQLADVKQADLNFAEQLVNQILDDVKQEFTKTDKFKAEMDVAFADKAQRDVALAELMKNKQHREMLAAILPKGTDLTKNEHAARPAIAAQHFDKLTEKKAEQKGKTKKEGSLKKFFYKIYFILRGINNKDAKIVEFFIEKGHSKQEALTKAKEILGRNPRITIEDDKNLSQKAAAQREEPTQTQPQLTPQEKAAKAVDTLRELTELKDKHEAELQAAAQRQAESTQDKKTLKDILTGPELTERIGAGDEIEQRKRVAREIAAQIAVEYNAEAGPAYQSKRVYAQKAVLDRVFHDGYIDPRIVDEVYDGLNLTAERGGERVDLEKQALKDVIVQRKNQLTLLNEKYLAAYNSKEGSDGEKRLAAKMAVRNQLLVDIITNQPYFKKLPLEKQGILTHKIDKWSLDQVDIDFTQYGPVLLMEKNIFTEIEGAEDRTPLGMTYIFKDQDKLPIIAISKDAQGRDISDTYWHELDHAAYAIMQDAKERALRATYEKRTKGTITDRLLSELSKEINIKTDDPAIREQVGVFIDQYLKGKPIRLFNSAALPGGLETFDKITAILARDKKIRTVKEYFDKNLNINYSPVEEVVTFLRNLRGAEIYDPKTETSKARLTLGALGIDPEKFDPNDQNDLATLMLIRVVNRLYENEEKLRDQGKTGALTDHHLTLADLLYQTLDLRDRFTPDKISEVFALIKSHPELGKIYKQLELKLPIQYDFEKTWPADMTREEKEKLENIFAGNPNLRRWQKALIYELMFQGEGNSFEPQEWERGLYTELNPDPNSQVTRKAAWWEMQLMGRQTYFPKAPGFTYVKGKPGPSPYSQSPGTKYAYPNIFSYVPFLGPLISGGGSHAYGLGRFLGRGDSNYPKHLKDPGLLGAIASPFIGFDNSDLWDSGLRGRPRGYYDEDQDPLEFWTSALGMGGLYARPELKWLRNKMERLAPKPRGLFEIEVNSIYPQTISLGLEALGTYNYTKDQTLLLMRAVGGVSIDSYTKQASIDKNDFGTEDEYRNNSKLYQFIIDKASDPKNITRFPNKDRMVAQAQKYLKGETILGTAEIGPILKGQITDSLLSEMLEMIKNDDKNPYAPSNSFRINYEPAIDEVGKAMMQEDKIRRDNGQPTLTIEEILDRLWTLDMKYPHEKLNTDPKTGLPVQIDVLDPKTGKPTGAKIDRPPFITINNQEINSQHVRKFIEYFYIAKFKRVLEMGVWGQEEKISGLTPAEEADFHRLRKEVMTTNDPVKRAELSKLATKVTIVGEDYSLDAPVQIGSTFTGYPLIVNAINPLNDQELTALFSAEIQKEADGSYSYVVGDELNGSMQDNITCSLDRLEAGKSLYWEYVKRLDASGIYMEMSKVRKKTWQAVDRWDSIIRWMFMASLALAVINPVAFGGLFSADWFLGHIAWSYAVSPWMKRQAMGWGKREKAAIEAFNQLISMHEEFKALTQKPPDFVTLSLYNAKKELIKEVWKSVLTPMNDAPYSTNFSQFIGGKVLSQFGV